MIIAYIIAYIAAYIASKAGHDILSGIILILMAVAMYVMDYLKTKNFINLRGLFTLGFLGGEGVACLKLSYIEGSWENMTWLCFFFGFIMFYLVFELLLIRARKKSGEDDTEVSFKTEEKDPAYVKNSGSADHIQQNNILRKVISDRKVKENRLFACIAVLTGVSLLCFVAEAMILGYIPLFVKGVPHAYSYFHISGVHYFTVSCVLVPSMAVVWYLNSGRDRAKLFAVIICTMIALAIPVLCVSRFQIIFAIVMAVFTYMTIGKPIPVKWVLVIVAVAIGAFALLSIARSHDADYLNSIFEMKMDMPVDISRVYIYIANNYDNFDTMVKALPEHTWGLRLLFPAFALTGLKFKFPQLVSMPLYTTKPELTTLTLIYDFYYDFGVVGVFIGSSILGALAYFVEYMTKKRNDPMFALFYSQLAIYMALAFFTTWFSNPTTWFYLVITAIAYFISTEVYTGTERV